MPIFSGYHGTNAQFSTFEPEYSGTAGLANAEYGEAYFFTDSQKVAADYARAVVKQKGGTPVVMEVLIGLSNPMSFDFERDDRTCLNIEESSLGDDILVQEELIHRAREAGCDGLIATNFDDGGAEKITQYVVFRPSQIEIVNCNKLV